VQLDSLTIEKGLTAWLGITEGKQFKPEKYYFQGNKYTKEKTLIRLSGLDQASVVNTVVLQMAEDNILRKNYIKSCQVVPVDPSSVLIKIEEGKMASLEGVMGLARRNGKTELTGLLRLQFLNISGTDRAVELNWRKNSFNSDLELAYHESGPVSFPISGDIFLSRVTQDSTWIRSSVSADIYSYHAYQLYGLELAAQSIVPGDRRPMLISKSANRSIGAFWRLDSRDQQFNPTKGAQTDLTYRIRNADTGRKWSNALEAEHIQFIGLTNRLSLSLGLHLRTLAVSDTTDYLQYRMGGYNSLRGYHEDEFSSWRLGWANLELRWLLSNQARVYLFYDHGARVTPEGTYQIALFAPGLGIKVRTTLGILSIEYALGWRDNGFANPGAGMIHAGLDASF
jgi:outer membrane protein assembly factor BamA